MPHNIGDLLDAVETVIPKDALAFAHGARRILWGDAALRSNRLARAFQAAGLKAGSKIGHYMRNKPAYCETLAAGFKARMTHVNVNYRYTPDEVFYILDNADCEAVVFDGTFRNVIEAIRPRLAKVKLFLESDPETALPAWAQDFEAVCAQGDGAPLGLARDPDDLLFLYTGGTTGMPKGVMWPHAALRENSLIAMRKLGPAPETIELQKEFVAKAGPAPAFLPASPLMHGTGLLTAIGAMVNGAAVVTLPGAAFDAHALFAAVETHKVATLVIVGDAFAKPMLRALDEAPGKYDTNSLVNIVSSGVMWSVENKRGLLKHIPQTALTDAFGSSEAVGFGTSVMTAAGEIETAKFALGEHCKVFDAEDREVPPGSGRTGIIARSGAIPFGYYKDAEKTAKTFREIGGVRYSMPGDWCMVEADGTLTLLGRGSASINTGGEKVFPEEVEEALKLCAGISDALVFGLPDENWGQAVTAVVALEPGAVFDEAAARATCREKLAAYKSPKRILAAPAPFRAPNGKADYKAAQAFARAALGLDAAAKAAR